MIPLHLQSCGVSHTLRRSEGLRGHGGMSISFLLQQLPLQPLLQHVAFAFPGAVRHVLILNASGFKGLAGAGTASGTGAHAPRSPSCSTLPSPSSGRSGTTAPPHRLCARDPRIPPLAAHLLEQRSRGLAQCSKWHRVMSLVGLTSTASVSPTQRSDGRGWRVTLYQYPHRRTASARGILAIRH